MGLEVATYISSLVTSNPVGGADQKAQGDDHLRLIKSVLQSTFPNASKAYYFPQILTKSADYSLLVGDGHALVVVDTSGATRTISLPNTGTIVAGWKATIIKAHASNSLIIDTPGAETINGAASVTLTSIYDCVTVMWDGTEWKITANNVVAAATTSLAGKVELLTQTELNTGTDSTRVPTADILKALARNFFTNNVSSLGRGYLAGLGLSNNGTDAVNDIDVAVGECRDSTNAKNMALGSAITKRLDASWAVGTNQGGLDTGTVADGTYHVWLIERSDTGVTDVLFSTSASAPTMPTNYDYKRRIGSIIRSGATILAFSQLGDEFLLSTAVLDVDATNPGTSAVSRTLTVPDGIKVRAIISVGWYAGSSGSGVYFSSLDQSNQQAHTFSTAVAVSPFLTISNNTATYNGCGGRIEIRTNTSRQIRSRAHTSGASDHLVVATYGWVDRRGRDD